MLPELFAAARRLIPTDKGQFLQLGLKANEFTFSPTEVDYLRKFPGIWNILSAGGPSWSGETVSAKTALQHPVVFACVYVISNAIGATNSYVMQTDGKSKREVMDHPMFSRMLYEPDDEHSAIEFKEQLTANCLLTGSGFAKVIRRSGTKTAIGLQPIDPDKVTIGRDKAGNKVFEVKGDRTYTQLPWQAHDIMHLKGITLNGSEPLSVLECARQTIGTGIAAMKSQAAFWANGGRLPYMLKLERKFKDAKDAEEFRAAFMDVYRDPQAVPMLEPGIEYKPIGTNAKDAQSIEWIMNEVSTVCRFFNISPIMVHDLSRSTFSNVDAIFLQFKALTLEFWMTRWDQAFRRDVYTPEEKAAGMFLRHDAESLLRGDFKMRMEAYSQALQNGFRTIDEVRAADDYDPLPGGSGSRAHIQINMGTLSADGTITAPVSAQPNIPTGGAA